MKLRSLVAVTLFSGSLAFGQIGPAGPVGPAGLGGVGHGRGGPGGREFGFHGGKVVTGAPYSANVTNTSVKTLPDGNTIQRSTTGTVARDSQGRTYTSETVTGLFGQAGKKTITFISDPVAGYVYTLNADKMTAMRRPFHQRTGAGPYGPAGEHQRPVDPNVVSSDEEAKIVNGVLAHGKLTTHTIPAGAIGNEKPIVATTDTWFSTDLQVVVSSVRNDLREGTSTYALTGIVQGEPAATLFQVPAGYTVKDAPSFGGPR